jgi:hypothetical protein
MKKLLPAPVWALTKMLLLLAFPVENIDPAYLTLPADEEKLRFSTTGEVAPGWEGETRSCRKGR